ncbi:MAG: hypothetical protein AB1757_19240 [Acidobacteriota bacterium]
MLPQPPITKLKNRQVYFLIFIIILLTLPLFGQSGRNRQNPKKQPASPPQQTQPDNDQPEASQTTKKPEPGIQILVVYYKSNIMHPDAYSDIVLSGCLNRLQESALVSARPGKEMNRKEASDFAKASKDTYVLWFELENEIGESDRSIPSIVSFTLYLPETGKSKTSGRIYTRQGTIIPRTTPRTTYPGGYRLEIAGEDLADRILNAIGLPK